MPGPSCGGHRATLVTAPVQAAVADRLASAIAGWTGALVSPQAGSSFRPSSGAGGLAHLDGVVTARPVCFALPGTWMTAAAALLALWRAGHAPAPLDLRLGARDIADRIRLVRPELVLTIAEHEATIAEALRLAGCPDVAIVSVDPDPHAWQPVLAPRSVCAADPGLIIFTSGTTGTPKAVLLTRANVLACAEAVVEAQRLTERDRVLNALSFAHINAPIIALLATVLSGGDLYTLRRFEPSEVWQAVAEHGITWINLVPPLIAALARHPRAADDMPRGTLRFVRSASSPLPPSTMAAFESAFGVAVVESYGVSEAASQLTMNDVPPGRRFAGAVGWARGIELRIVGLDGADLPAGQPGEVLVRGPSVMAGYLDDPAATAAALRDGWLWTGDVGILDDAGVLRLVGRNKEFINRGGEKIAPRAVEEALMEHPAIADAAVVGVPDDTYGEEIKAFVVLAEGVEPPSLRDLRHFANSRLPVHARPRDFAIVPAIPRNPSGKLRRADLM
jgi:acyl-CoA synthetase (AMP-forming)/AMP-acid ligase II